jgi:hypothetical protein
MHVVVLREDQLVRPDMLQRPELHRILLSDPHRPGGVVDVVHRPEIHHARHGENGEKQHPEKACRPLAKECRQKKRHGNVRQKNRDLDIFVVHHDVRSELHEVGEEKGRSRRGQKDRDTREGQGK